MSQEHGDLINLYDWYQSFKVAVSSSVKGKRKAKQSPKSKKRKVDTPMEEPNEALLQYPKLTIMFSIFSHLSVIELFWVFFLLKKALSGLSDIDNSW